ncbi:type III polyketide synthase [Microbacterium sp.]|uniref:type III polyketide synthase n=1 Tax=Microbacterium sp. TaxID=51671 RepID=UPI0028128713|nr:type III polyketide synthase [Microbacterium sp.]
MTAAILRSLQTIVPDTPLHQDEVRDVFAAQPGLGRLAKRLVTTAFDGSGVRTRHTVLRELDLTAEPEGTHFYDRATGELREPGTRLRNDLYAVEAERLFVAAARRALDTDPQFGPEDVTHVITVSCTGFHAPGPDYAIVRALGLSDAVQRYHLGFMGCYASMPALRCAAQFCAADPDAVVLVVSVELCTLHLRSSEDPDAIIASSLFADGAAAGIVSAHPAQGRGLALDRFHTAIAPQGEKDMAWTIGDTGFEMVLSTAVPQIIGDSIHEALRPLFAAEADLGAAFDDERIGDVVQHWAIHPGGRSILDHVQSGLALADEQLTPARDVLRDYGNMSSATVLFVLRALLDDDRVLEGERVSAMAFGPGLTAESALLTVTGPAGDA